MTFLRITQLMNAEAEPEAGTLGKSDTSSNDTLSSPQPSLFLPLACTLPWQFFNLLHNTSNGLDSNWFTKLIFHEVRKKKYTNQTKITLSIIGAVERGQKSHLWSKDGCGAVQHPGADGLTIHTGRALLGSVREMAGLPRQNTRATCPYRGSRG